MSVRGAALVVLAWNQWPRTARCLDSLLATALDRAEVIVVDNGSQDATPTALRAYADRVRIVTLPENLGFVRGMNAGIAAARADDDVVLLNNDLVFTQTDWLGRLRDAAYARPDTGIVGCRQLGPAPEHRLYHAGGFIEGDALWGQQIESGRQERDAGQYPDTRAVQGIAFAVAYLRRDCIERIGVLDTAFHSYFEDTDYCLRATDAGIATVVAGTVTVQHDQHGSTQDDGGFRARLWAASRAAFAQRWQSRLQADYRADVVWRGVSRMPYGHAHLARQLVRRLDARGLRMSFERARAEVDDFEDYRLELAARRRRERPAAATIVCAQPGDATASAEGVRIGLAWVDWAQAPARWVDAIGTLEHVLVPDAFQRDAFVAAGVRAPVAILPLGVDRDYCHPAIRAPRDPQGRFVFLAVVDEWHRDAPDLLVRAFVDAFDAGEPVLLLVVVRPGPQAVRIVDALARERAGDARVRVLGDWGYPWYQRSQWLIGADAVVGVRRGGGWDPFLAEALACGRPIIASDFGSPGLLARAYGTVVACGRVADPDEPGAQWAQPDAAAYVAALRETFARAPIDPATRARDAAGFARGCDIDATADLLVERIAQSTPLRAARARAPHHRPIDAQSRANGQIVVLGMHRSGTSSIAGLLARMGAWCGPADDLLVGPDNPGGHYESGRLHMACVRRLQAAGGDWRRPPWQAPGDAIDAFRREVADLLDEFEPHRPWMIKEPRLCLLARELLPLLCRPVFVHVVRSPRDVAASLRARDGFDTHEALALWEHYTRAAFAASAGWSRCIVDYDAICAYPLVGARALHAQLAGCGVVGLDLPGDDVVRDWLARPERASQRSDVDGMTPAQRELLASIDDRSILDAMPGAHAHHAPASTRVVA